MPLVLRAGAVALATATTLVEVTMTAAPASAHTASTNQQVKLAPRTHFTMKPDGSERKGPGRRRHPEHRLVKSTIRTYYNATDGIADKTDSPYIDEMKRRSRARGAPRSSRRRRAEVASGSRAGRRLRRRRHHAVDLRHGGRGDEVQLRPGAAGRLGPGAALPGHSGMVKLVTRRRSCGCTIFGLTGRNDAQKVATLANLAKVDYTAVRLQLAVLLHQVDERRRRRRTHADWSPDAARRQMHDDRVQVLDPQARRRRPQVRHGGQLR